MKAIKSFIFAIFVFVAVCVHGQTTSRDKELIDSISYYVMRGMIAEEFPGCQVIAYKDGKVLLDSCYGYTTYDKIHKVEYNTLYDLASVTKCMATTIMAMKLYDDGLFKDSRMLKDYLPKYDTSLLGSLSMTRLFTHSSGVVSSLSLQYKLVYAQGDDAKLKNWFKGVLDNRRSNGYDRVFGRSGKETLYAYKNIQRNEYLSSSPSDEYSVMLGDNLYLTPRFYSSVLDSMLNVSKRSSIGRYQYSDVNFFLIREALEEISSQRIDQYLYVNVYGPLKLENICYTPLLRGIPRNRIAPTEFDMILRDKLLCGEVHDEFAAIMGGTEGNAGLFSNARDVFSICRQLLDPKDTFFSAATKKHFISQPYLEENNYRALGFERKANNTYTESSSFGHTGFTGTFFQIDRSKGLVLVFLSNTVHPSRTHIKSSSERTYYKLWRLLNN